MLVYLDNQSNHKGSPNENYAREIMELHTLGVNGGYTQQDVMELARCFTGWTVKEHFWRGEFTFNSEMHDPEPKIVLGMQIQTNGQKEAELVVERLAEHPSTAKFIAYKLARRFIADQPPLSIVEKAAQAFLKSRGDVQAVLRPILLDGLKHMKPKYKPPMRFVVSALRALQAETDGGGDLQKVLADMGQLPFKWPTPDGYPDDNESWKGNLIPRWQFASRLAISEIKGTSVNFTKLLDPGIELTPETILDQLSYRLLGVKLANPQRQLILESLKNQHLDTEQVSIVTAAALIASPMFQWY
jgi:uncharacterized protein (DUF1800 family)